MPKWYHENAKGGTRNAEQAGRCSCACFAFRVPTSAFGRRYRPMILPGTNDKPSGGGVESGGGGIESGGGGVESGGGGVESGGGGAESGGGGVESGGGGGAESVTTS